MEKIILHTDGGSRGNPGLAGVGAVILDHNNQAVKSASLFLGQATNNEAEYQAVLFGLDLVKKTLGVTKAKVALIEVRLDSELVERQLNGIYQIKEERLWPYFMKIWNKKVADFKQVTFVHVKREHNKLADRLANEAMDRGY